MTDHQQPHNITVPMTLTRIEVTACQQHPDDEPTMPGATCSVCGQQLQVRFVGTVRPHPDDDSPHTCALHPDVPLTYAGSCSMCATVVRQ